MRGEKEELEEMTGAMIEEGFEKGRDLSRAYMRSIADIPKLCTTGRFRRSKK